MSSADLHPEDLLDRVRRGQATPAERERVDAHLASCEACRFERAVLAESMRDAAPRPGDAARARAIEQAAVAVLAAAVSTQTVARRHKRRALAWVAAVVASTVATAAAAAVITQPAWLEQILPEVLKQEPATRARQPKPVPPVRVKPAPAPVVEAPVQEPAPLPVVAPAPEPCATVRHDASPRSAERSLRSRQRGPRRARETATAVRLYRELTRAHARSPEGRSRGGVGRLLLDRTGDARGALREFDAYLADADPQSLREEALIGRALALGGWAARTRTRRVAGFAYGLSQSPSAERAAPACRRYAERRACRRPRGRVCCSLRSQRSRHSRRGQR